MHGLLFQTIDPNSCLHIHLLSEYFFHLLLEPISIKVGIFSKCHPRLLRTSNNYDLRNFCDQRLNSFSRETEKKYFRMDHFIVGRVCNFSVNNFSFEIITSQRYAETTNLDRAIQQ